MDPRKKQILFIIGAALVSLTIAYVILEIGAVFLVYGQGAYLSALDPTFYQQLRDRDPPGIFEKSLYRCHLKFGRVQTSFNEGYWRGYSYPKAEFRNLIHINNQGFRSSKDYVSGAEARVAVLGDSFVQGLQVPEENTFVKVAEKELHESGRQVEVLNYGISSTGTVHQFRIFEELIISEHPQAVVLAFFPNDLVDNSMYYYHEAIGLVPQYTFTPSGEVHLGDFDCHVMRDTREPLVSLPARTRASWRIISRLTQFMDRASFSLSARLISAFLKEKLLPTFEYATAFDIYLKDYPKDLQEALGVTVSLIDKMNQQCRQAGIKFIVMLIPSPEQVYPALWQQYIRSRGGALSGDVFDLSNPQRELSGALLARGIPFVDLLLSCQGQRKKEVLYYPKDRHFNVNGHRLAGKILAEQLKKLLSLN